MTAINPWKPRLFDPSALPEESQAQTQPTTAAAVISLYCANCQDDLDPETFRQKNHYLGLFVQEFGSLPYEILKPIQLKTWIKEHPAWKSPSTRASVIKAVKRAFNWAVGEQLIRFNPFVSVRRPADASRRNLTDDEFQRALRRAAPELRRILFFMRWTGCRPGEARKAMWDQVDWGRKVLVLKVHKTTNTQEDPAKPRNVPLPALAIRLLQSIRRHNRRALYVFLNRVGKPWQMNSLSQRWVDLRKRTGLSKDAYMYGVRHQYGTDAMRSKSVDIKELSMLMGHSSVTQTERYVHLAGDTDYLLDAAERAIQKPGKIWSKSKSKSRAANPEDSAG